MLEKFNPFDMKKKGQMGGGIIGVVIGLILIIAVAVPVTLDTISSVNVSGTASTILNLVPVGLALAALILGFGVARK